MDRPTPSRLPHQILENCLDRLRRLIIRQQTLTRWETFQALALTQSDLIEILEFYTNEPRTDIRRFNA